MKIFQNKKRYLSIFVLLLLGIIFGVWGISGKAAEKVGPAIGYKAPDFTLDSLTSQEVQLAKVVKENKVTLVNFWGIWCPYCVREIPELVAFYNQYHRRGVEILAINVGDNPKNVPGFAKNNRMNFPILFDKNNTMSNLYQVAGFPTTFIIDRSGKIREIIIGSTDQKTLAQKVETVLKEK